MAMWGYEESLIYMTTKTISKDGRSSR